MSERRLMWVEESAIHNGPDTEGYWLIDGGGYDATEVQAIADAWDNHRMACEVGSDSHRMKTERLVHHLLDALTEVIHEEWCNVYKNVGACSCTKEDQ